MASVTQRIKAIQQPHGGYLPMKLFSREILNDGIVINEEENIHSSLVGIAVDYLTRYMSGSTVDQAFHISTMGAELIGMQNVASKLKSTVTGLDDVSIISACKLAGFDVCFRSSIVAYKPIEEIAPDKATIQNIRTMVKRSLVFWKKYGPIINSEPTFEGGYSSVVNTGDGDYVTKDTLWDFKVSKNNPTSKHTLQILMYYVMGLHSIHPYYKNLTHLGFFNPRLNVVYRCPIADISKETIATIESTVICYDESPVKTVKTQTRTAVSMRATTPNETFYSVADICAATGQKKSAVYAHIHSGKLDATKKGNKYVVSSDEYDRYVEYVKAQRMYSLIALAVVGIIVLILFIRMFLWMMHSPY